jgi:hypothetical protein
MSVQLSKIWKERLPVYRLGATSAVACKAGRSNRMHSAIGTILNSMSTFKVDCATKTRSTTYGQDVFGATTSRIMVRQQTS